MMVVLTGGAGFIGSATLEELLRRSDVERVLVVDNMYSGSFENIAHLLSDERTKFLYLDIAKPRSIEVIKRVVAGDDDVVVLHLAAMVSIDEVRENPSRALEVNVVGTLNMLELARQVDAKKFIYASSVAVYGEPQYVPIDEHHPRNPVNLYGLTKLMSEELLRRYYIDYGVSYVALRYFNVYGPRMRRGPYAGVIHKFITALLRRRPPTIYGTGEQTRDFVYVYDVAEANVRAIDTSFVGEINIGSGVETSINDLYREICRLLGINIDPVYAPPRPGDVRRSLASIERARQVLGWSPRTPLREGLRKTIEWYLSERSAE